MRVEIVMGATLPVVRGYVEAMITAAGHEPVDAHPDVRLAVGVNAPGDGVPTIRMWTGSDILAPGNFHRIFESRHVKHHLVGTSTMIWNILSHRIDHADVDVCPIVPTPPPPGYGLGQHGRVLCYAPRGREELYQLELIHQVACAMPTTHFVILRAEPTAGAPRNMHFEPYDLGPEDMEQVYDSCRTILRVPKYDGASLMVLEALEREHAVVWNGEPFWPGVTPIGSVPHGFEVARIVEALILADESSRASAGPVTVAAIRERAIATLALAIAKAAG